jgi:hypothetical protein
MQAEPLLDHSYGAICFPSIRHGFPPRALGRGDRMAEAGPSPRLSRADSATRRRLSHPSHPLRAAQREHKRTRTHKHPRTSTYPRTSFATGSYTNVYVHHLHTLGSMTSLGALGAAGRAQRFLDVAFVSLRYACPTVCTPSHGTFADVAFKMPL